MTLKPKSRWKMTPLKSRKRPRRDCPGCGRPQVAIMADGSYWPHQRPGFGMWDDYGGCMADRKQQRADRFDPTLVTEVRPALCANERDPSPGRSRSSPALLPGRDGPPA